MANWYISREDVKRALQLSGAPRDTLIDEVIEAASREIDKATHSRFIPLTETRQYPWPQRNGRVATLYLDAHLIAADTLTKDGDDVTAISSSDYFLEPVNDSPPYHSIQIDLASTAFFQSNASTWQRAIRVTGRWGYSEATVAAGTVTSGLDSDATATTFVCSDGSLIDVGDSLLIESELIFVSERASAALGSVLINDANVTASRTNTTFTLDPNHGVLAGEVMLLNSERTFVESVDTNDVQVIRAYDGTTLAAHADDTPVHVFRTLTIERGVNGTTAATHANSKAISRYRPEADIRNLARALAEYSYEQGGSGWIGAIGGGEATIEGKGTILRDLFERTTRRYKRTAMATV